MSVKVKLFYRAKHLVDKAKKGRNVTSLEVVEVVLVKRQRKCETKTC